MAKSTRASKLPKRNSTRMWSGRMGGLVGSPGTPAKLFLPCSSNHHRPLDITGQPFTEREREIPYHTHRGMNDHERNEEVYEGGDELFELGPGDIAVVMREDGEAEVYVALEGEGAEEQSSRARYLTDFLLFALESEECKRLFTSESLPELN